MKILFALGAVLLVSFAGLSAWLLNPFDQQSWRFSLNAPRLGAVQLHANPVLQLAMSFSSA